MNIYFIEINGFKKKSFSTEESAFNYLKDQIYNPNDRIRLLHEEYIEDIHGSETICRLYVLYSSNNIE